ncbi:MAG: ferredoxin family protein [Ignavibacteria bacterium]|nr:ferredoxin family protein [Ignavibacteria bacterium]
MIKGYIEINKDICKGCELCIEACPQGSLRLSTHINTRGYRYVELVEQNCTGCTNCALVCPDVAITVFREQKPKKAV